MQLTEAAIALDSNDRDTALAKYKAVSADGDLPDPYRNLALIRATSLEFDKLKPEEVVSRLEPMTKPGNPWFGTAGELTAMAYLKQGQKDKAGRVFAAIAADRQVPDSILTGPERGRLAWGIADVFAWQVDFSRDIQPGDQFQVRGYDPESDVMVDFDGDPMLTIVICWDFNNTTTIGKESRNFIFKCLTFL